MRIPKPPKENVTELGDNRYFLSTLKAVIIIMIVLGVCLFLIIESLQPIVNAQSSEGIHMRRFYDEETGTLCYTVFGDDNGLSTSCVQVGSCGLDENPKFFTVK